MNYLEELKNNKIIFFTFMRNKYPIFFNSNIFFRDIQYAINTFFEMKNEKLTYKESENLAVEFISYMEANNELVRLNDKTWKVNFHIENSVNENESVEENVEVGD